MRAALVFTVAAAAWAQPDVNPTDVLRQTRDKLIDRTERIPNYTCVETVNRSYLKSAAGTSRPPSCDYIIGGKKKGAYKLQVEATDRLRLDAKVSDGREIGAWAGSTKFDSRDIADFIGGGPFGTGALGTLIGDIFPNAAVRFAYEGQETFNNRNVLKYHYQVPVQSSHFLIKTFTGWVPTAFSGGLWIEPEALELRRLTAQSGELPPESDACFADMDVSYERARIGERDFLLPRVSELHFVMRDGTETHSLTRYSECHEYHAESTLRFDDATGPERTSGKPAGRGTAIIPPGLTIRLALTSPLDTDTTAAGDVFTARIMDPVRRKGSKEIVVPVDATVRGRIVTLRHYLGPADHFELTLLPESIEFNGVESPLYAMKERTEELTSARRADLNRRGVSIWLAPPGGPSNVGTFHFPGSKGRVIVSEGYKMTWVSMAAPKQ